MMCLTESNYSINYKHPMGFKIRSFFSYIIAALIYLFINKEDNSYKDPVIKNKFLIINSTNYEEIFNDKWIVFLDCQSLDLLKLSQKHEYNFALLKVNSFSNAKLAASLGLSKNNRIIKIKNSVVYDNIYLNSESRNIKEKVPLIEILDFFIYFVALDLKKNYLENKSVEKIVEDIVFSIFIQ